jgi:DNA-binding transcriptional MocR family regulator
MNYRYNTVVEFIRKRIEAGTLKVGDRLPSIRQLSVMTGFSTVTVHHGYELLESHGYCVARPRSGFYLARIPPQSGDFPETAEAAAEPVVVESFPQALLLASQRQSLLAFGSPHPSSDLYDCTELDRALRRVLRGSTRARSDAAEGDAELRMQIAKRAAQRGVLCRYQNIVATSSGMQAFNLCLDAFTEPGDVILVESPSYFPTLSGIKRRNLRVIEIYSHPRSGTDPEQFEYLVKNNNIKVALLMANHHFPTGVTYSDDALQRIVQAAQKHGVTIIENDMLGELSHSKTNAASLKQFDAHDTVLQFSSFEYSLAPEYGIGWVVAGKHARRLVAASYLGGYMTHDWRMQRAVADYLASRSQDRNLRRLCETLAQRMERGLQLLADALPRDCSITRPTGGFTCWVRAPQRFSSSNAVATLQRAETSILPGPVFSAAGSFDNFFALNLSFPWSDANIARIQGIGDVIAEGRSAQKQ